MCEWPARFEGRSALLAAVANRVARRCCDPSTRPSTPPVKPFPLRKSLRGLPQATTSSLIVSSVWSLLMEPTCSAQGPRCARAAWSRLASLLPNLLTVCLLASLAWCYYFNLYVARPEPGYRADGGYDDLDPQELFEKLRTNSTLATAAPVLLEAKV